MKKYNYAIDWEISWNLNVEGYFIYHYIPESPGDSATPPVPEYCEIIDFKIIRVYNDEITIGPLWFETHRGWLNLVKDYVLQWVEMNDDRFEQDLIHNVKID